MLVGHPTNAKPSETGGAVVYLGATLIDGQGGAAIRDSAVVIRGSDIEAVGAANQVAIPAGARIVRLQRRWIVPGLIDAHVHFFESGRPDSKYPPASDAPGARSKAEQEYASQVAWIKQRGPYTLARYVCAGVTSAISVGGPRFESEMKQLAATLGNRAPAVYTAIGPLTTVPSQKIFLDFDSSAPVLTASTAEEARRAVQEGSTRGFDLVKLGWLSEPSLSEPDPRAMLSAAAEQAHKAGLRADIHVLDVKLVDAALDAGVDALAHTPGGGMLSERTIERLRDRHIVVTSTLLIWRRALLHELPPEALTQIERDCGDPDVIRSWKARSARDPSAASLGSEKMLREVEENLKRLHNAGVEIAVGTDAGNEGLLHGASFHAELQALAELGFSPSELIVAATRNSARLLGSQDKIGTVVAGHRADFLILTADPVQDIHNLEDIETIVRAGRPVSHQEVLARD